MAIDVDSRGVTGFVHQMYFRSCRKCGRLGHELESKRNSVWWARRRASKKDVSAASGCARSLTLPSRQKPEDRPGSRERSVDHDGCDARAAVLV